MGMCPSPPWLRLCTSEEFVQKMAPLATWQALKLCSCPYFIRFLSLAYRPNINSKFKHTLMTSNRTFHTCCITYRIHHWSTHPGAPLRFMYICISLIMSDNGACIYLVRIGNMFGDRTYSAKQRLKSFTDRLTTKTTTNYAHILFN